jgi:hypothetical protein
MRSKIHAKDWYRKNRFRGGTGSRRFGKLGVRRGLRGEVNLPPWGIGDSEERKKRRKGEERKGRREEKRVGRQAGCSTRSSRWDGGFKVLTRQPLKNGSVDASEN